MKQTEMNNPVQTNERTAMRVSGTGIIGKMMPKSIPTAMDAWIFRRDSGISDS